MDYKVYFKHWYHRVLHCIAVEDASDHFTAIVHVQSDIQAGGDYKSKPFLVVIQGGKK
jgi:hypothetical protein